MSLDQGKEDHNASRHVLKLQKKMIKDHLCDNFFRKSERFYFFPNSKQTDFCSTLLGTSFFHRIFLSVFY